MQSQWAVSEASDATYEQDRGSGGFLIIKHPTLPAEQRFGCTVRIPDQAYAQWGQLETYIAQLEMMMVLAALIECGMHLRHARDVFFIDNTAALMALVRGRSNQAALDHMALLIHLALFVLQAWVYFEWVESKANWADGISRLGMHDPWYHKHHFAVTEMVFPHPLLGLPIQPALLVFEYLLGPA